MDKEKVIVKILSLDGGGIRGIIPSVFLGEIHNLLRSFSGKKHLYEHFDMLAGTSTGGLLALGLATPLGRSDFDSGLAREPKMNFEELIRLYSRKGHLIFPAPAVKFGSGVRQMLRYKYDPSNLEQILLELFGEATMKGMLRPTVVTSYDISHHRPFIFRMYPHREQKAGWEDFYIRDVGRSTSAAPSYFPPAHIAPVTNPEKKYVLVDGGVVLNNPSMIAYCEAKALFPNAQRFIIVSLGTGIVPRTFTYDETRSWGALGWMNPGAGLPLLEVMMGGQSSSADYMLNQMPDVELYRLNVHLDAEFGAMDKPDKENVEYLQKIAARQVHQSFDWLKSVCQRVASA